MLSVILRMNRAVRVFRVQKAILSSDNEKTIYASLKTPGFLFCQGYFGDEYVDNFRVKSFAALLTHIIDCFLAGPCFSVGPIRGQCIPIINQCKDPCMEWDFLALQFAGIPCSIPVFVM